MRYVVVTPRKFNLARVVIDYACGQLYSIYIYILINLFTACSITTSNTTCYYTVYVEIKCQLDETEVFIADLVACSTCFGHHYAHHRELKSIIQWLLPVVFRAVVFK